MLKVKKTTARNYHDNRLNLVLAIIFLLVGAIMVRLFYLQVVQYRKYSDIAAKQYKVSSTILPSRGNIFISDTVDGLQHPVAIDKEFSVLYVVPHDVTNDQVLAEKLYEFFNQAAVEKTVDSKLAIVTNQPVTSTITGNDSQASTTKIISEFKLIQREANLNEQKSALVTKYLAMLQNKNDRYEAIDKKAEDSEVIKFFWALASSTPNTSLANLIIKNNQVVDRYSGAILRVPGVGFDTQMYRYYPEGEIGGQLLGFAGQDDSGRLVGKYGLEGFFNDELSGKTGSVASERGAGGVMIVNDRNVRQATDGSDLILTIDDVLQFNACQKLAAAVQKHGATAGSVIIMNPQTGAIAAMCNYPDFDPNNFNSVKSLRLLNNPAIFDEYEPGSVFKAITMAAALDAGKVTPQSTYNDTGQIFIPGWPKPISNSDFAHHGAHGKTTMVGILEDSLNVGAIHVEEQLAHPAFATYVQNFGFGSRTGIELQGEADGNITGLFRHTPREIDFATASFGQGLTVTPLQMITAYAAIANGGRLMKPFLVQTIIHPDGSREQITPIKLRQVISLAAANTLSAMLINVVESGNSIKAQVPGYYIAGKTGTAQVAGANHKYNGNYIHTFIGYGPADTTANNKFIILTKIDNPKDAIYAESTALPLAHDLMQDIISHWQIAQDRTPLPVGKK